MPPKTARILLALGGKWDVAIGDNGLCVWFYRNDGVKVYCGTIDDIFPDYKAVIPKPGKCVASVSVDKEELIREIKTAIKFSNKSTNKIELVLNGSLKIHSLDVDFDTEYTNELKGDIKYKDIDEKDKTFKIIKDMPENCYRDTVYIKEVISDSIVRISYPGSKESFVINRDCLEEIQMDKIAFNGNFIIDIAKRIDKNKPVEISLFGKTKAAIFNKSYLVMPLLTNN